MRKWDELTREIDRDERNEKDSKHYAQALVQHARQQRAAREAREAREAEKEFKAAEAASSLCVTERGAGPHDAFVRAVIKGDDVQIVNTEEESYVDMAEAEKARKDGNTAIAFGNYRRAFWRYADGLKAIRYADDDEEAFITSDFICEPSPSRVASGLPPGRLWGSRPLLSSRILRD